MQSYAYFPNSANVFACFHQDALYFTISGPKESISARAAVRVDGAGMTLLLHLPDVVGLKQFLKVVVRLLGLDFFHLLVDAAVVGRCLDIAYHAESHRETVLIVHHGELELQGVVFAVAVVYEDVFEGISVASNLDHLEPEAFLHESIFMVFAETSGLPSST